MTLQNVDTEDELFIPFTLNGVILVIEGTRKPTKEELEECPYFCATPKQEWDLYLDLFLEQECRYIQKLETGGKENASTGTYLHFRYLNLLNNRSLTEVGSSGDGLLIDCLIMKNNCDLSHLSTEQAKNNTSRLF